MIAAFLVLSIFINILLFISLIAAIFYLIKFARIILNVEDALTDAIDVFEKTSQSANNLLKIEAYFESPEVKHSVSQLLGDIKLSNIELLRVIKNFTNLSKNKHIITVREEDNNEEEDQI